MTAPEELRERVAAALYEAEAKRLGYDLTWKSCVDRARWLYLADAALPAAAQDDSEAAVRRVEALCAQWEEDASNPHIRGDIASTYLAFAEALRGELGAEQGEKTA